MSNSATLSIGDRITLPSGHAIPQLGFGVYQSRGQECENAVKEAINAGYRHIDTAQAYRNEELVGRNIANRSDIFITTKYMPSHQVHSSTEVYEMLKKSLPKLNGKKQEADRAYIDLVLIHAPWGREEGRRNNWEGLRRAQNEGWARDIGVSNFGVAHLKALPEPLPALNQIELHPWCQQREIVAYCQSKGIAISAYCPLVRAEPKRFQDPVVVGIAEKLGVEVGQILLRWSLQKGYIPLPKSVTPSRIRTNADLYDFELSPENMSALDGLDEGKDGACSWNPVDSE